MKPNIVIPDETELETPSASDNRASRIAEIARLERASRALEPGTKRRKKLRRSVDASVERFLRSVDSLPAYRETDDKGIGIVAAPISENGVSIEDAIELYEDNVIYPGGNPASAGHLGYIPGGGLYHSALGDYLAAVSNKYAGVFFSGPGAVRMENMLVRWVADLVGLPASAGGYLASGGSIATLTAIATARDAHELKAADYASAVVYGTDQSHHSIDKALTIAGMAEAPVRRISMDDRFRMRPDALADAIASDRARGLRPWLVLAAAGTTDTGAVDPLDEIGAIAERERCWFHVDAAYGGFFLLTEHGREKLAGIARADSTILDPHKSLFLPYGCGIVVVRDRALLARTHGHTGVYMQDAFGGSEQSPAEISPELSKHFRGLRMWLPLMVAGVRPFRAALSEKLLLANYFYDEIQRLGFEVGPEPDLSIVTFRWAPAGVGVDEANRYNQAILDGVRRDGRVFLSSTMIDGRYTLRVAVLAFRTHRRTIDLALTVLAEQVGRL